MRPEQGAMYSVSRALISSRPGAGANRTKSIMDTWLGDDWSMCIWLGVNVALLACHDMLGFLLAPDLIGLVGPSAGLQLGEEVEVRGEQRVLGGSHTHTPPRNRDRDGRCRRMVGG
jgi:hypothetical protein